MEYITGRLGYNPENDRYGLLVSDLWKIKGFHCGERLEVLIDDEWIETRIEMNNEWYLSGTDLAGEDIEYLKARIKQDM